MGHLFAGAFGVYRNAEGHRHVFREPESAAEIIMFASQLLRLVDAQSFRMLREMGPPVENDTEE